MSSSLNAMLMYAVPGAEKPVNETFAPGDVIRRRSGATEQRSMKIIDGRSIASDLSLDRSGFMLTHHPTKVSNFFDPDQVTGIYYREVEALVREMTGATRVVVFDHTVRSGDEAERAARKVREPVLWAHNDYTEWSGPQRLRDLLPAEADQLLTRRLAIVQVWRGIHRVIERNPLAMLDARSVDPAHDFIAAERRYPDRVGETYQVKHNPAHRWVYFSRMQPHEAIVFKVYDSLIDGRARFTPHVSFDDPSSPPDAPARQSIEARTMAFF